MWAAARTASAGRPPGAPSRVAAPALGVKVDNVAAARPPTGLAPAEVVYVEPVEGGFTRLLALYGEQKPPVVGPVRSARESDLQLLAQYGRPALAFSGAAPELLPLVSDASVVDVSSEREPGSYYRDPERESPNNLFLRPEQLPEGEPLKTDALPRIGTPPAGGTPTNDYEVRYSSATVGFTWSAEQGQWLVSMDGKPYTAVDSGRVATPTVIVQKVSTHDSVIRDAAGNPSPVAQTVGSGQVTVLRDGKAFEGNWNRPAPEEPTTYTGSDGQPIPVAPGQVWIVLAP